jgi:hypothetical protein
MWYMYEKKKKERRRVGKEILSLLFCAFRDHQAERKRKKIWIE